MTGFLFWIPAYAGMTAKNSASPCGSASKIKYLDAETQRKIKNLKRRFIFLILFWLYKQTFIHFHFFKTFQKLFIAPTVTNVNGQT